ncbi:hypothetical protein ABZ801_23145 [Actinomadura sp. NPDC047616]|uniref:hypothetical protein n=1 Tax=Actinomadura sp. NPDC047616 TaxID=3155914 RepID=UPI00340F33B9
MRAVGRASAVRCALFRYALARYALVRCALAAAAAGAGAAAVAVPLRGLAEVLLIAVNAALAVVVLGTGLWTVRLARELREGQAELIRHVELQTRVLHNAARLAAAAARSDERGPGVGPGAGPQGPDVTLPEPRRPPDER